MTSAHPLSATGATTSARSSGAIASPAPSRLALATTGALLWALLLALPALFLVGANGDVLELPGNIGVAIAASPLAVLAVAVWRREPVWTLLAFPLALALATSAEPAWSGPRIYGLWPFLAVLTAGFLYLGATLRWQFARRRRPLEWRWTFPASYAVALLAGTLWLALFSDAVLVTLDAEFGERAPAVQVLILALGGALGFALVLRSWLPALRDAESGMSRYRSTLLRRFRPWRRLGRARVRLTSAAFFAAVAIALLWLATRSSA